MASVQLLVVLILNIGVPRDIDYRHLFALLLKGVAQNVGAYISTRAKAPSSAPSSVEGVGDRLPFMKLG